MYCIFAFSIAPSSLHINYEYVAVHVDKWVHHHSRATLTMHAIRLQSIARCVALPRLYWHKAKQALKYIIYIFTIRIAQIARPSRACFIRNRIKVVMANSF